MQDTVQQVSHISLNDYALNCAFISKSRKTQFQEDNYLLPKEKISYQDVTSFNQNSGDFLFLSS